MNVKESVFIFQEEKKLTNLQLICMAPSYLPNLFYELLPLFQILHTKLHLTSKFRMPFYSTIQVTEKLIIIQVTEKAEKKEEIIRKQEIN